MQKNKVGKVISSILVVGIITNYFLGGLSRVDAKTNYKAYTTGDVNFRREPNTNANTVDGNINIIMSIDEGSEVTVVSDDIVSTSNCKKGWKQIIYNDTKGYICSAYLAGNIEDEQYGRPWNTPKKAIMGGAKWIGSGYISRGQYTSYLKKFNVNPKAESALYNHQYQTNIAAPSSESITTYNAYKKQGLLELDFIFSIPIFNNMADRYDRYIGYDETPNRQINNLVDNIPYQDEITDQTFEETLNNEGFPESYKRILRYLHTIHPTWQFKGMQTGEDFSYAVNKEKLAGAIDMSNYYDKNMKLVEGSRWYVPTTSATAYYMDPRNFLTEKYIFQFESLNYDEKYTEELVQGVLNNTFMKKDSILDKQSYKSIFVEAGKTYDMSPLYLASLARQELGVNGSIASTGERFTYNGNEYQGIYNFFNIGATTSVYPGLIYATGYYCMICGDYIAPTPEPDDNNNNNNGNTGSDDITVVPSSKTIIDNLGLKEYGNYLKGFNIGSTISSLKAKELSVIYSSDNLIATGTKITFNDGKSYTAIVYGDLTGDGLVNSADLLRLRQYLLSTKDLSGAYKEAADLTGDGIINSADLLKLRQYLLGQTNINQL
ncbi:MAG: dockerin type I domain-containing protein [Bacilli bacterium]|nr:dockerin type I domain-containing protein [Bacilli bacterium]